MLRTYLTRWSLQRQLNQMKRKLASTQAGLSRVNAENAQMDQQILIGLLAVIGSLIVLWAYLENAIDAWVEVIHRTGGAKDIQAHLPSSLDRELDYLKDAWKITKVPQPIKDEGERLLAEIHRLKSFRHDLVHGLADLNTAEALSIHLWKVKGSKRVELKTPYSDKRILENTKSIVVLQNDLDRFVIDFANATIEIVKRSR